MKEENIYDKYDNYIIEKNKKEQIKLLQQNHIDLLQNEQNINLEKFHELTNIEINEDDMDSNIIDSNDSISESDFENIDSKSLLYGNYSKEYEIFENLTTDEEKKKYLIETFENITHDNYKFGNYFQFTEFRSYDLYYIGKNDKIVDGLNDDEQSHISYELTKYTRNAINDFKNSSYQYIDLRYDDKFIKENIVGNILEKWNWNLKFTYSIYDENNENLTIESPNGSKKRFKLNTHINDIIRYFKKSNEEQCIININLKCKKEYSNYIMNELIPITWKSENIGGTGNQTYTNVYIKYTGPLSEKEEFINLLEKSYTHIEQGISFKITDATFGSITFCDELT